MKKQIIILTSLLVLSSGILGCGTGEGKTELKSLEEEETVNCFFPNLDNTWVGDVMAQADENGIHLNYLYDTDHNGVGYHPIYRFDTKDFCSYDSMGEIIPFAKEIEEPDVAVGTGSFIKAKNGTYHCFYTGHNDYTDTFEKDVDRECLMHATSKDNVNYVKKPKDTIHAPEGYSTNDFRDPQVFYNEEAKEYWMLVGAIPITKSGSSILKYTSKNLSSWKFEGEFYHSNDLYFMECPDLFKINDWYYLVFSWNNVTYYRMTKSLEEPWITPDIDTFDGNGFYAAKTVEYEGIRYLVGFLDHKKRGSDRLMYTWAGSLMPYELVQKEDGSLGATIPHQFLSYFKDGKALLTELDVIEESKDMGVLPKRMLLEGIVTFHEEEAKLSFLFGQTKDNPDGFQITLDCGKNQMNYDAYANSQDMQLETNKAYDIKMVVENEVVVLYVGEEKVFSNRVYSAVGEEWKLLLEDAQTTVSNIKIYGE